MASVDFYVVRPPRFLIAQVPLVVAGSSGEPPVTDTGFIARGRRFQEGEMRQRELVVLMNAPGKFTWTQRKCGRYSRHPRSMISCRLGLSYIAADQDDPPKIEASVKRHTVCLPRLYRRGLSMKLVSRQQLLDAIQTKSFIDHGDPLCAEDSKYDIRASHRFLKGDHANPIDARVLSGEAQADLVVRPGEVVFMLSEESLNLPKNMIAQLSPKRKMSQNGILTLGGFTVDPGYRGHLLIGLYNFSSTDFPLRPLKKAIGIHFYLLDEDECENIEGCKERLTDFPDDLINMMGRYKLPDTGAVERLRQDVARLEGRINDHDNWEKSLKKHDEALDRIEKAVADIAKGLRDETTQRISADEGIKNNLSPLERVAIYNKVIMGLLAAIFLGGGSILVWGFKYLAEHGIPGLTK